MNKNFFLMVAILFCFECVGLTSDKGQIKITSKTLDIDYGIKKAEYHGDVFVKQGKLNLKCNRMEVYYEKSSTQVSSEAKEEIKQINFFGDVVVSKDDSVAKGDKAEYNKENDIITMQGNASLKNKDGYMEGEKVTYNNKTGKFKIVGATINDRVRIILND